MTQQVTQEKQPSPQASRYVQYSADVILWTGTLARRLCAAPTLVALAAARLLINVLHSQMQRRATVEEGAAVLDLVRQNIKSARRPRGKKLPLEEKRIDIGDAFSLACSSGALEDIDGESDPFEAVVLARKYLEAYRVVVAGHPAPPVTLEDGAEFIAILTRCRKRGE